MIDASKRAVSSWFALSRCCRRCAVTSRKISTHPETSPTLVTNRRGAVIDRALAAALVQEHRVVREANDDAFAQRFRCRVLDRLARVFVDDPEDRVERLPHGVGAVQPVNDSATAFM